MEIHAIKGLGERLKKLIDNEIKETIAEISETTPKFNMGEIIWYINPSKNRVWFDEVCAIKPKNGVFLYSMGCADGHEVWECELFRTDSLCYAYQVDLLQSEITIQNT